MNISDFDYYQNNGEAIELVYKHVKGNKGLTGFWKGLKNIPDILYWFAGHRLYRSELVYRYFRENGFAGYFDKQKLRNWDEVVFFIEDREDYYSGRYEKHWPKSVTYDNEEDYEC